MGDLSAIHDSQNNDQSLFIYDKQLINFNNQESDFEKDQTDAKIRQ